MKKEPFLQVSKRRNKAGWQERLMIRLIALIRALVVAGLVILFVAVAAMVFTAALHSQLAYYYYR